MCQGRNNSREKRRVNVKRMTIVLATTNQGKAIEFQEMLKNYPVDIRCLADFGPIPEVEEDGESFDDNAYKKALFTAKVLGLPATIASFWEIFANFIPVFLIGES